MVLIKNISFRKKLFLLVITPILGAIFFAGITLKNAYEDKTVAENIGTLVDLSIKGSLVVHELQKERGITSGFLASDGRNFGSVLREQRDNTDKVLKDAKLQTFIDGSLKSAFPSIASDIQGVLRNMEQVNTLRSKVDRLSISAPDAAKFYTDLNAVILALSGKIAELSTYGNLTSKLRSYYTFMQAKEAAGQERAILSISLSRDSFQEGAYPAFVALASFQKAYLKSFAQFASQEHINALMNIDNSPSGRRVEAIRKIANDKFATGNFGVSGEEWFKASTDRINQMKNLEDGLATDVTTMVESILSKATRTIYFDITIATLVVFITILLSVFVSKMLVGQALDLAKTINDVSKTRNLTIRARVDSTDELGNSAKSFNEMLSVLKDLLQQIQGSSTQLSAAAEETSAAVAENAASLEKQSMETSQAATATEEMTATVNEIAANTTNTAEAANLASKLSREGVSEVDSNAKMMNDLNDQMSSANNQVIRLRDSSKEITEIVDVIKAIAEQTNLLALNAAIEAARAGDQGRGFAVVADEVRTLALRTQKSTQQIEDMVLRFQEEASNVSQLIDASFVHVQGSLQQTMSVKSRLEEIDVAIASINDMCNQVATAAEEQVAATNEIAINIRTINDLADVSSEVGQQISQAAREQSRLAAHQNELVSQFKL